MSELLVNSEAISKTVNKIAREIDEIEPILTSVVVNDTTILDALSQMLRVLHHMQTRAEQSNNRVAEEVRCLGLELARLSSEFYERRERMPIMLKHDECMRKNPEAALLAHLYSFIPDTTAIDIGAHVGDVSECLLKAGYSVFAFEPYALSFQKLKDRLSNRSKIQAFNCAVGPADTTMELHIAADSSPDKNRDALLFNSLVEHPMLADCQFADKQLVQVRSMESLRKAGEIPPTAGVLKIDTEGFDIEIIRSLRMDEPACIVMTEFWDPAHPFGKEGHGNLADIVGEMRKRGYAWHLVMYHLDEQSVVSYYSNRTDTVPKSWGNVMFFREHSVFAEALRWCGQVLTATVYC